MASEDPPENKELPLALLTELQKIGAWQDFLQGQITALQVAMFAALNSSPPDSPTRAKVREALDNWRALMAKREGFPSGQIAGFDAALHVLETGMHPNPPATH